MLGNYIKVALRNLRNNKLYSAINIGGLAVGLAACLLILLFVRDELSYERWIPNVERIAIVETTYHIPGRDEIAFAAAPGPMAAALAKDFSSDIEHVTRTFSTNEPVRAGEKTFLGDFTWVDPDFFDIFDLPMVEGNRAAALANNASIILSQRAAHKYFGNTPAVGKTITVGGDKVLTVVGVFADLPRNTHLDIQSIALFDPARYTDKPWVAQRWTSVNTKTYALFRSEAAIGRVQADLPAFSDRNVKLDIPGFDQPPSQLVEFDLMPLLDIHLHADKQGYNNLGSYTAVIAFAGIALLILIIACINFVNLATARAMKRAREVAMRKVVGSTRGQLIGQHLGEAIITALIALVLAIAIAEIAVGPLGSFLHKDLKLDILGDPTLLLVSLGLIVVVGTFGGLYPAIYLSRFRPAEVLKANQSSAAGSSLLRSGLVVFQFAISIALIVCTATIYGQTVYARNYEVGFQPENRLSLSGLDDLSSHETMKTLKQRIAALPGVRSAALSSDVPPLHDNNNTLLYPTPVPGNDKLIIETLRVDPDFFAAYGVKPLAGRLFSADRPSDFHVEDDKNTDPNAQQGVVINQAFAAKLGAKRPEDAIGKTLYEMSFDGKKSTRTVVIGVVADLHLRSLRDAITPFLYYGMPPGKGTFNWLTVDVAPGHMSEVQPAVRDIWKQLAAAVPIRSHFVADDLSAQYDTDAQRGKIFTGFALFAVLIACLGLFGLASFSASRRTKEIGMRKVLGASIFDIVRLLVWQFSRPVIIANLIAWPVSFYLMSRWLAGFKYAIDLTSPGVLLGIFGGAGLLALAIAWLTVAGHAYKVARANPGRALRVE